VKEKLIRHAIGLNRGKLLALIFIIASTAALHAQSPPDADVSTRLVRARALAAAHNLAAAANELDAIRKTTTDDSVRDVARLMLMEICLEEGNYMRAQTLLEELYVARSAQNESTTEAYFALAGQALNGARQHLERYRSFGINVADKDLPADAVSDLDRLRTLLERIADEARAMSTEEIKATTAAAALLEDVASLRASLARSNQERQQWQREMASARQKLSAEEARMTPVSATIVRQQTTPGNGPASATTARNETVNNSSTRAAGASAPVMSSAAEKSAAPLSSPSTVSTSAPAGTEPGNAVKTPDGKPVNVGSLIEKATQRINPLYPQNAKTARITGIVTVLIELDQTGTVRTVQSMSGPVLLRQAAEDAARRWKFRPTLVAGQPVRVTGFINFNFTL
jgi:TonB family protein